MTDAPTAAKKESNDTFLQFWQGGLEREFIARHARRWLTHDSSIFAVGSCFAVNIIRWLTEQGVKTPAHAWGLHYNPATIFDEVSLAAGIDCESVTWTTQARDGQSVYIDAKRHPISASSLTQLDAIRAEIVAKSRACFQMANGFVFTLGLSEVWEQNINGKFVVVNRIPDESTRKSSDFRTRFLTVDEVIEHLRLLTNLIRRKKGADIPIVFTVSPIPLKASKSEMDIQSANLRSKANLISAVHAFLDEDTAPIRASYFPAFEMISGGPRPIDLWQHDQRHLHAKTIDTVCTQFTRTYATSPGLFFSNPNFKVPLV